MFPLLDVVIIAAKSKLSQTELGLAKESLDKHQHKIRADLDPVQPDQDQHKGKFMKTTLAENPGLLKNLTRLLHVLSKLDYP